MKKLMTSAMTCMLLLSAGSAQAWYDQDSCYDSCEPCCSENAWYIGGFAGANWITGTNHHRGCFTGRHHSQTGYALAASIGRSFCENYRVEFEYTYRHNNFKSHNSCDFCAPKNGHVHSNAFLVNGFWDISFCNNWCLKPFVGAGIGWANQRLDHDHHFCNKDRNKKNGFAWQVIAGVEYELCNNIDLSIEYRFFQGGLSHVYSQAVGAGFRYNF